MKTCFKCKKSKSLVEFYKHPRMADGHLNKCKDCTKASARHHRAINLEKIQAYDRMRGQDPKRKSDNRRRYFERISTKSGRKREWARTKEWKERNHVKRAVHIVTGNAIKYGRLVKGPCAKCGIRKDIHAHHEDYTKPMEVTWLCRGCHGKRHREINEERRRV